ncbi:pleckstrin homology domain-containing family M member 2 [Fopius arisanus]|uniref:Pleckstrin homology domain-containing family M member 2 n=2 Tax=Fopius arisanus TaxID=64838 RepID=A0A0C9QHS4_9HYME|nr:PREDICTED: pleckstrin homology domain-containing family M member 2 [Fopius arisanus]
MHRPSSCGSAAPSGQDVPVLPSNSCKITNIQLKSVHFRDDSNVNIVEKMPSREDMDMCTDKVLSKGRILQELTKAVKLVYAQSLHGSVVLDGDSWLVYWLDRALRHGLRVERHGYWGTVRELSHQDTIVVIHALQSVLTSIGKGRAWLYHTLSEGSFESYLACFLRDTVSLKKQYFPHALVRDADKTHQLINLLAGLENVSFTLQLDVTYLDICNYMPQRPMSGSPSGTALSLHLRSSSVTSSLASPGDSGVALDSDMEGANETDASSYKEEDYSMEETPKYRNTKYKSIMTCPQDNKSLDRSFSSSDSSEEGKTPVHSPALKSKFQHVAMTKSDIANQNITTKLDDNELNCSSLDTLKDYNIYSKSLDESRLDKVNNDVDNASKDYSKRSSYYADGYSFKKNMDSRNSYVINNDTNLLELSMTISDCDCNAPVPYSILNTINMTDTSILSSSGSEAVVQRRQRKKKRGETKKRVSFHEDIFKTMKLDDDENFADFSMSFVPPNSVQKKDAQKGRYSWCANGDSPYVQKAINTRNANSDYYSSSSSGSIFDSDCGKSLMNICDRGICLKNSRCTCGPSMSERGVPEGQEDPGMSFKPKMEIELEENEAQEAYIVEKKCGYIIEDSPVKLDSPTPPRNLKYTSSSDWSDVDSMTTSTDLDERRGSRHLSSPLKKRNVTSVLPSDTTRLGVSTMRPATSSTSLLSRFLRSITERKFDVKKNKKTPKSSNLYIKGVSADYDTFKDFNDNLEKEIQENIVAEKQEFSGEKISLKLREIFKRYIYRDKTEELYKVYKVRSSYMNNGDSKPMLALLTDKTLYLTGTKADNSYSNQFVIPYNELDVIMIGPNAQTILISNADYEMQYLFSTGSSQTTSELISHLEMAMRRSPSKPRLPAVKELSYDDMHSLKYSILTETAVHRDEKIEHYSLIYIEDDHISPPSTPCGPTKEGDLMFRPHSYQAHPNAPINAWEAGYFVLKGGVVYMFTDSSQRLPKRAIPLKGGLCQGCRRIPNSHRPHTFEILLKPNKSFQFAAPDEYVASEWLQSFVQSASGLFDTNDTSSPMPCSLIATTNHLVAMKEVFPGTQRGQTLSCASVEDLTAFRVPLAQQSWCILEFACREVHESSGDWVIYFTNYTELCAFREVLETLWADANLGEFPMVTLPPENKLHRRCSDASKDLEYAWKHLLPVSTE